MTKSRTAEASLRVFPPDSAEAKCLSPEDSFPAVPMTPRWFASAEHMRSVMIAIRVEGLARRRAGRPSMQLNV